MGSWRFEVFKVSLILHMIEYYQRTILILGSTKQIPMRNMHDMSLGYLSISLRLVLKVNPTLISTIHVGLHEHRDIYMIYVIHASDVHSAETEFHHF